MAAYDITTANSALEFDTQRYSYGSICAIDANHFAVTWYAYVAGDLGKAQILTVNTSTWAVTTGNAVLAFATTGGSNNACALIDANHFINIYREESNHGYSQVFTVNTTTWAVTTSAAKFEFLNGSTRDNSHNLYKFDTNHFVIGFSPTSTDDPTVQVLTINTTNWTITTAGASKTYATEGGSGHPTFYPIDSTHFINFFRGDNYDSYAEVFTVNTSTWAITTAAAALLILEGDNFGNSCYKVDTNHFINYFSNENTTAQAVVVTVNTTTWAVTTANSLFVFDTQHSDFAPTCSQIDANHFIAFWGIIDDDGGVQSFTVNTSTWAITTAAALLEFDTQNGLQDVCYRIDTSHFINCWQGVDADGFAQVFSVAVLNAYTLALSETLTESDTITKFRGLKKTLTETITESDVITKSQAYKKTLTDNFTVSEVNGVTNGDSYALGGGTGAYVWGAANYAFGQSFTGSGETLRKVRFSLYKDGNPTGNCYAKVYAETHATAFGVDSVPTGSPIATSDAFDVANLPSDDFVWETFTFSGINNISLSSGTNYCVTFEYSGGDTSNRPLVECDYDIYSHTGNIVQYGGSWNSDNLGDTLFYIYGTPLTFATYLKSLAETFTQTEELVLSYIARKTLELIESIGMTDTLTKTQTYIKSLIDTFTQSDTVTHLATWTKSLTESFSVTDALSVAKTYILNLSDSIGLTDTITSMRSWILNLSESTSITDSLTTFATYIKSLIDTFTESDTITKAKSFFLNLTESIATFDTLTKLQGFVKTLDETFAVSDTLSRLGNYIKTLTETFTESDAITTLKSVILSLSESVGITDTITKVATYSKTFLESTSITDTLSAKANYLKSLVETFTESDTVTKLLTRFLNLSESIGLTDILTKVVTWIKNLSETTWMSEILKTSGNWWNELTKHSSTWTDGTKHSSSYTNSTKHSSSWTNREKLQ